MSHPKITAKNLQYNSNLPPFLARLRGQHASDADRDGPDPILAARRRPVKPRSGSAEAEDAPLVVDEHGNTVDVAVGADGSVREAQAPVEAASTEAKAADDHSQPADADAAAAPTGEKLAGLGDPRKKRKLGRVVAVGADEEEEEEGKEVNKKGNEPMTAADKATSTEKATGPGDSASAAKSKLKKKAKKIKLSFGDDEG